MSVSDFLIYFVLIALQLCNDVNDSPFAEGVMSLSCSRGAPWGLLQCFKLMFGEILQRNWIM